MFNIHLNSYTTPSYSLYKKNSFNIFSIKTCFLKKYCNNTFGFFYILNILNKLLYNHKI